MLPSLLGKAFELTFLLSTATLAGDFSLGVLDLNNQALDPFAPPARTRVFLFVRSDCPITNRYAPELQRISAEFSRQGAVFFRVYADNSDTKAAIEEHGREYGFPGIALRDPEHRLAKRSHATVAPEAAVFDLRGKLAYYGRIDDRYVEVGKSRPQAQVHDLEAAIRSVLNGQQPVALHQPAVGCSLADVQ
jgi:AhpC/TSA family